jgi:hypothetical protein
MSDNLAFNAVYQTDEDKPMGCGTQGCTWKVVKKNDPSGTVYAAKIYHRNRGEQSG